MFTDELHQAKNERRKAERLWRRTGLTVHKEIYRAEKWKYSTLLLVKQPTSMKESQNAVITQKLFQKLWTTSFFDTKRQNWQRIVKLKTSQIDL